MPLIVLSNRHILHILYICVAIFTAPIGARLCYFPEAERRPFRPNGRAAFAALLPPLSSFLPNTATMQSL